MGSERLVRLVITGRVQRVSFRYHTMMRARQLGLSGYVRNLPDGSVEAVAKGEAGAVAAFIEFCRQGSPAASVEGVDISEPTAEQASGLAGKFRIAH